MAALRILLDLEAREMAWLPSECVEKPGDTAEPDAGMPGLAATFGADDDINWPEPALLPEMAWQSHARGRRMAPGTRPTRSIPAPTHRI